VLIQACRAFYINTQAGVIPNAPDGLRARARGFDTREPPRAGTKSNCRYGLADSRITCRRKRGSDSSLDPAHRQLNNTGALHSALCANKYVIYCIAACISLMYRAIHLNDATAARPTAALSWLLRAARCDRSSCLRRVARIFIMRRNSATSQARLRRNVAGESSALPRCARLRALTNSMRARTSDTKQRAPWSCSERHDVLRQHQASALPRDQTYDQLSRISGLDQLLEYRLRVYRHVYCAYWRA
jgi:hypothetical protein